MAGKNVYLNLRDRGFIHQSTSENAMNLLEKPLTFYMGIDPTAGSLHIGHVMTLMMFRKLQEAGHKGILLIGGATASIGDPTGKNKLRKVLTEQEIKDNIKGVRQFAERFIITDGDDPAMIVNNANWFEGYEFVEFMKNIGSHFNVNTMLSSYVYKNRLESGGLTFLEMGYMLMQAYDFLYLRNTHNCSLQIGGSDQWGNIVAGIELCRKMWGDQEENFGLTCPLLLTKDGKKMGKSTSGTIWVDKEKTSVIDFYQYFYNIEDEATENLLLLFSDMSIEDISWICKNDIVSAKRKMAHVITELVHSTKDADEAEETIKKLFLIGESEKMPQVFVEVQSKEIAVSDLLVLSGFLPSKNEAKRLISQGGIEVDGIRVSDPLEMVDVKRGSVVLRKGKKSFLKTFFQDI